MLRDELDALLGERPHLIICNLSRRKLDANRDIANGAQHAPHAEHAWRDYHGFIEKARACVTRNCGRGILFDVHGQSHPEKLIELGYVISSEQLTGNPTPSISSIRTLSARSRYSFDSILRGAQSLGARLQKEGFGCVPSPAHRAPPAKYYSGGYTVQEWGSMAGGALDAIQLELPYNVREGYKCTGPRLASVLADYVTDMYTLNCNDITFNQNNATNTCFSRLFWDLVERILYF